MHGGPAEVVYLIGRTTRFGSDAEGGASGVTWGSRRAPTLGSLLPEVTVRPYAIVVTACLLTGVTSPTGAQTPDPYAKRQALFERLADSQLVRLAAPGTGR